MIESEVQKCVLPISLLAEFWFSTSMLLLGKKVFENMSGDVSVHMRMRGVKFEY